MNKNTTHLKNLIACSALGLIIMLSGCTSDAVGRAARTSLASFVTQLTNAAITSTINPG